MNREPIYSALFAKLQGLPGVVTASRRLRHWSDVSPAEQPAVFMAQKNELAQITTGQATRWTLAVDVYLYVKTGGSHEAPGPLLNPLLDAIESALAVDNPIKNTCTLGGLVQHCRIEGAIETDEGTLGDQAVCIVPIVIFTA